MEAEQVPAPPDASEGGQLDNSLDPADDGQATADLMRRITAAGATTLGQVAAIVTEAGVYGLGSSDDNDRAEVDAYPWVDAVRWRPDDGWEELDRHDASGSNGMEELFSRPLDAEFGSREDMGWCGLLRHADRSGGMILRENPYGRRSVWATDAEDELVARWEQLQAEHEAYRYATQAQQGEHEPDDAPRIWVASLADYTAGHLHGAWLDATVEPDDLANAVQFILRNSHEREAEEYGVFDYDGFGHGISSLLGEYPSLATVSKIAQGVAEHGEAYAAWAAYVGPEQEEQLDRFEDHYLGEYASMEAYVEDVLAEIGVYRDLDEALEVLPEDLRRYVQVDVEGLARDWGFELYVVETTDGGVMVFGGS